MAHIIILLLLSVTEMATAETKNMDDAYSFSFKSIDGKDLPLKTYEGKVVLIVNTASQCGFTKQYSALQELWARYRERGFVVIGVPSNDFGSQEPEGEVAIKKFCEVNFNIDFPLTEKVVVKGENAHPFYNWAKEEAGLLAKPRWNFHKYLIDGKGKLIDWFSSPTSPLSAKVINVIETELQKSN